MKVTIFGNIPPQKRRDSHKVVKNAGINNLKQCSTYSHPDVALQVNFLKVEESHLRTPVAWSVLQYSSVLYC